MRTIGVALAVAVACAAGCSSQTGSNTPTEPSPSGPQATVNIEGDAYLPNGTASFAPGGLTIARGTTVTWRNTDQTTHTTTSDTGVWGNSIAAGDSFSRDFPTAGSFEYHCALHTYMTGTITVQ